MENWKKIPNSGRLLEVSDKGRIRSVDRTIQDSTGRIRHLKGRILRLLDSDGYKYICITKNGKPYAVHRLVAEAFIPNTENKPFIDHIDTNPSNNSVSNLRWVSQKENLENPNTRKKMASSQPQQPVQQYKGDELIATYPSVCEASRVTKVSKHSIFYCLKGERKQAGGFLWRAA